MWLEIPPFAGLRLRPGAHWPSSWKQFCASAPILPKGSTPGVELHTSAACPHHDVFCEIGAPFQNAQERRRLAYLRLRSDLSKCCESPVAQHYRPSFEPIWLTQHSAERQKRRRAPALRYQSTDERACVPHRSQVGQGYFPTTMCFVLLISAYLIALLSKQCKHTALSILRAGLDDTAPLVHVPRAA